MSGDVRQMLADISRRNGKSRTEVIEELIQLEWLRTQSVERDRGALLSSCRSLEKAMESFMTAINFYRKRK